MSIGTILKSRGFLFLVVIAFIILLFFAGRHSGWRLAGHKASFAGTAVPYPAQGPTTQRMLNGIPVVDVPDTTESAEKNVFPGKGWRVINTGTLPLFLDRLSYIDIPHMEWAKPYRGGKIKMLYINTTYEIGEATMLEQRGDLECYIYNVPIYIDWYGPWQTNAVFLAFLERRMKEVLAYNPDVILVTGAMADRGGTSEGSLTMPQRLHEMILDKVNAGAGLILIPGTSTKVATNGFDVFTKASPLDYKSYTGGCTNFSGSHPITDGIPLEQIRFAYRLQCEPKPGAEVPVTWGNKLPFLVTGKHGAGRVAAFGYSGRSIPDHPCDPGSLTADDADLRVREDAWRWHEYAYAMVLKAVAWAANREPRIGIETGKAKVFKQGEPVSLAFTAKNLDKDSIPLSIHAIARNSDYETVKTLNQDITLAANESRPISLDIGGPLREGAHMVDIVIRNKDGQVENFGAIPFSVTNAMTLTVKPDKDICSTGDTVKVETTIDTAGESALKIKTELWDTYGRLMEVKNRVVPPGQASFSDTLEFSLVHAVGHVFDIKTSILRDSACLETHVDEISIPRYEWGDDWRNKMWSISSHQTDPLYKAIGIDDMTPAAWAHRIGGFRLNARGNFGQHSWSAGPHPGGIYPQNATDDQHHPTFIDPDRIAKEEANIKKAAQFIRKYGVIGFSLSGESVCYFDSSYDPITLKAFNEFLKSKYQTVDALNAQWDTQYKDWAEVGPIKTEAWKKKGTKNFSQWLEFRRFMDKTATDARVHAAEVWRKELDYPVHVGQEQTFGLWQHTIPYGCFDYYGQLSRGLNCWISYDGSDAGITSGKSQVNAPAFEWLLLTSWCKGPIRGIGGWPSGGLEGWQFYVGKSWSVLFNGGQGMDWYEPSMFLAGYGALLPGGAKIYEATHEIKSGIAKLLLTAQRKTDPVAVWQDMANEYAGWLLGTTASISRWDMVKTFYANAVKPIAVSMDEIEAGALREKGIKLLYMPHIVCVSDKAAEQVRQFVEAGGSLLADYGPGAFDALGKPRVKGALDEVFGISRSELVKEQGSPSPLLDSTDDHLPLEATELPGPEYNTFWESGLKITTGKALGIVAKNKTAPAFIVNHFGKGHALLLNYLPDGYGWAEAVGRPSRDKMAEITKGAIAMAGIKPELQILTDGKPLRYFDVNRFQRGSATYACVLRYPDRTNEPDTVTVQLPSAGHIYEVRSHRYLAQGNQVSDTFKAGDFSQAVKIYAVLPYQVSDIRVKAESRAKRGEVFAYSVTVDGADGTVDHVLRIEVMDPEGHMPECYQLKALAIKGRYEGQLPFALNDMPGAWQIRLVEVISGKETIRSVVVRE